MSSVGSEKEILRLAQGDYSISFAPNKGMNFLSLKKGNIEAIDQTTKTLFENKFAGLGAMIGPHFHHRAQEAIVPVKDEERFPHIAFVKKHGGKEPFSHGIGRYAPWAIEAVSQNHVKACLRGSDKWMDVSLKELEGQDFVMNYEATVKKEGIEIQLQVESEKQSVVGLHTYYALENGQGVVQAYVQDQYNDLGVFKPIPDTWEYEKDHLLTLPLKEPCDYGFLPYPGPLNGAIELKTKSYKIRVQYSCNTEENSMQVWHPEGASFVCLEPLSAKNPRQSQLKQSQLKILISILT